MSLGHLLCAVLLVATTPAWAVSPKLAHVGFAQVIAPDRDGPALTLGVWYPTSASPEPSTLILLDQAVAANAMIAQGRHPLVVISHGAGGSLASHLDTALALAAAGFIVVAPQHTGDNYRDHSEALALWERPPQIASTLDYMLGSWPHAASIDAAHIGMFGFSAGGFTTLVVVGGRPDYGRIDPFCAAHEDAFVCRLIKAHGLAHAFSPPDSVWVADRRVRAAVIAAPALGFTFTRAGLAGVKAPIQLWGAADDEVLPVASNADAVRRALPEQAEYHLVPGARHADFLAPCTTALAAVAPDICREEGRFDRAAFHRAFDAAVVRFFVAELGRD